MKQLVPWIGIGGLALFLVGGLASLVTHRLPSWSGGLLLAGVVLLLLYVLAGGRVFAGGLRGRTVRGGANAAVSILAVLAIVVLVQAGSARHSKRWDLTQGGRFSLSPQTAKVVAGLGRDVEALAFYKETTPGRQALADLLGQYAHYGRRFTYRFIDPDRHPGDAKANQITSYGTLVLRAGDRQERVYGHEEREITNALIKVSREGKKKFYFLTGHGEHGLSDAQKNGLSYLRDGLGRENFDTEELLLMRTPAVPADCAALVVAGPTSDLLEPEIASVRAYLDGGGKALFLLDPGALPNLESFLGSWGVVVGHDVIIDRLSRLFGGDFLIPIVSQYPEHDITKGFGAASFFPQARSVDVASPLPAGLNGQQLALTGAESWGEIDQERLQQGSAAYEEGKDKKGPVSVAVVVTKEVAGAGEMGGESAPTEKEDAPQREARLVVFGDSDFTTNANVGVSGNANLVLNTLSWLAEEEDLVAIRPKNQENSPVLLTAAQGRLLFYLPVVGIPLAILATGTIVLVRRRWRR